ncbi:MAG TPA: cytochrome c [Gemmatimonadaceae bacterium]
MPRRFLPIAALTLVALAGSAYTLGGWAVVTVEDLPEYATAGKPIEIVFSVRQHGMQLLDALHPTVLAKDAKSDVQAAAIPAGSSGRYSATLVVPRPGSWTITINSGFMNHKVSLAAIPAVAPGAPAPAPAAPAERGQRLFVAKGCVTCHVHGAVAGSGSIKAGPELTPKRYQPEFLARFLADPSIQRTPGAMNTMPKLELKATEIAAITAFLNADGMVSSKQR